MTSAKKLKEKLEELVKGKKSWDVWSGVGGGRGREGGEGGGSGRITSLLRRTLIHRESPTPTSFSKPHYLLETPSSNAVTLGVRAPLYEWGGVRNSVHSQRFYVLNYEE